MINLNCVLILFCFLVLLCFSTKALGTTNEVVDALSPAAQASAVSAAADMADKSPEAQSSQAPPWRATPRRAGTSEVATDTGVLLRDPFWPIGFFPAPKPGVTLESAKSADPASDKKTAFQAAGLSEMLKIGGVIRSSGRFYATINGFTVQTGEVVTAVADGEVYKFVVEKIDFNRVQVKPVKQ